MRPTLQHGCAVSTISNSRCCGNFTRFLINPSNVTLPHNLPSLFIFSQRDKLRMLQMTIRRPFGKLVLCDMVGLDQEVTVEKISYPNPTTNKKGKRTKKKESTGVLGETKTEEVEVAVAGAVPAPERRAQELRCAAPGAAADHTPIATSE